jgi:hypothetical protein
MFSDLRYGIVAYFSISSVVYNKGWARSGAIKSNATQYNIVIFNHNGANGNVGPLFWAQYSYLGLDPRVYQINMPTIGL